MPGKTARSGPQRQLDGRECRRLAEPSVLGLPAIQKIPNFHVSSGFIWGIPAKSIPIKLDLRWKWVGRSNTLRRARRRRRC